METTTNYKLPQWVKADQIKMDDSNGAFANIDAALKANADATATGLNAEIAARGEADAALTKNLGTTGKNCRFSTGSYVGTGGFGQANARSLQFDFVPFLVFISSDNAHSSIGQSFLIRPFTQAEGQDGNKLLVTWTAHGVSWYTEKTISTAQNNRKDCTYQYFALGYDEPAE